MVCFIINSIKLLQFTVAGDILLNPFHHIPLTPFLFSLKPFAEQWLFLSIAWLLRCCKIDGNHVTENDVQKIFCVKYFVWLF